jgi:hypothetical protein
VIDTPHDTSELPTMPFHLSIPLPGPFSYSRRIGGRRRRRSSGSSGGSNGQATYWLLIGWWLVPSYLILKWTVIGTIWLFVYAVSAARGNLRPPRIEGGRIRSA